MALQTHEIQPTQGEREVPPFEETANVFAALDSEPKCLLLAAMSPHTIYTRGELKNLLLNIQGTDPGWVQSDRTAWEYCSQTLAPLGLVAQELADENGVFGYVKTPFGREDGTAIAGLLLHFSAKNKPSLYEVLGNASSSAAVNEIELDEENSIEYRNRAPGCRLKIFEALTGDQPPRRAIDLVNQIGVDRGVVTDHLRKLARKKIIGYGSLHFGETYKTDEAVEGDAWSHISLSEEQKEMLKSFLKIKKAVEGDAELRREGLSLAREYTNDSLRASYLMEKAKRTSPHSSGLSLDHRISQILDILVERGVGTTTEEIRAEMEREGTALSDSRIRSILRNLREAGVVDKENGDSIRALWRIHAA